MAIRIVIADNHEVVRTGLALLLGGTGIEIVGEATTGQEVVEKARMLRPDVVMLETRLSASDGLAAMESLRNELPAIRIVVFTAYDNPTYVARSVALGASEYVLKTAPKSEIVAAIRGAAEGIDPPETSLLRQIKRVIRRRHDGDHDEIPLTNREMQVLRHVALGLSNREIGRSLEISIETVKEHVQNMLRKLEVNDRTQAAVWAVRRGLV